MPTATSFLVWSFAALGAAVGLAFVAAVRLAWRRTGAAPADTTTATAIAAVLTSAWLGITLAAGAGGLIGFDGRPPTALLFFASVFAVAFGVGLSPVGWRLARGLPLALLVGFHGFRVLVELLMHRAYVEGLMPVQMSYEGRNLDVLSGLTAIPVALLLARGRGSLALVRAWNWLGLLLLANIVVVGLLSAPLPIRVFLNEPANVWLTRAPWVWLPASMVLAALLGHLLVFRRLAAERATAAEPPSGWTVTARG